MKKLIYSILLPVLLFTLTVYAQNKPAAVTSPPPAKKPIQISGIVVESDSLRPIPFVGVMVKNTNRGTVSDYYGYFSFVAQAKDTILFSATGFKRGIFIIPDTLSSNRYSLIQALRFDTLQLKEQVIYPWPTKEQFKEAFLKLNLPDDNLERAKRNMAMVDKKMMMEGGTMDANMNYKYTMEQQYSKLYYAGQLPPNNLLNPLAWAKFIQAWKKGDLKVK